MPILQVRSAENWSGGETHHAGLVDYLRKRGHDVAVAGRSNGALKAQIQLPFLNSADFITAIRLRTRLKREPVDVIHAHVARDYTIVAAAAWNIPGVKVVFTGHLLRPVRPHFFYRRVAVWISPTSQVLANLATLSTKDTIL